MTYLFCFEAIQQNSFEETALQYSTNNDPIGLLKSCNKRQGDLKTGTRRLNWQLWAACYAGAYGIRQQPELFDKLLEDDYFVQRTYKADFDDLLRLALLIGTDADAKGTTYKHACNISSRLQPLFDAEVEPMEVLRRIEAAGGLKGLDVSEVVAETGKADDEGVSDDEPEEGSSYDGDGEGDDSAADAGDDQKDEDDEIAPSLTTARFPARSGPSGRRTMPPRSTKARGGQQTVKLATAQPKQAIDTSAHVTRQVGHGMVILEVEVTQEMLSKVLNATNSILYVKRTGSAEGWQRVVGVTIACTD